MLCWLVPHVILAIQSVALAMFAVAVTFNQCCFGVACKAHIVPATYTVILVIRGTSYLHSYLQQQGLVKNRLSSTQDCPAAAHHQSSLYAGLLGKAMLSGPSSL